MIKPDEIKTVDSGSGYSIGEIAQTHKALSYLKPRALVCQFDGTDTLLDFVTKNMPEPKEGKSSSDSGRGDFNAFDTYEEALDVFRNHPERVVNFDPSELSIKDESEAGSQVDYDVTGDFIDMGRFMEGIPESVGTMHGGKARNRRVNIMVNLNQAHYISHSDITHRSERVLRLVDALEAGGVRSQLTGIESNECGHTEVILKRHDESLNISDLAVVTHPEFLRRVIFRINEHSKTWDWGYGSSVSFSQAVSPEHLKSDNNDEMNILIDGNMAGRNGIDKLFDQLERLLVWEMSKPVPEVDAIKLSSYGLHFSANGARSESEIQREGKEVINAD